MKTPSTNIITYNDVLLNPTLRDLLTASQTHFRRCGKQNRICFSKAIQPSDVTLKLLNVYGTVEKDEQGRVSLLTPTHMNQLNEYQEESRNLKNLHYVHALFQMHAFKMEEAFRKARINCRVTLQDVDANDGAEQIIFYIAFANQKFSFPHDFSANVTKKFTIRPNIIAVNKAIHITLWDNEQLDQFVQEIAKDKPNLVRQPRKKHYKKKQGQQRHHKAQKPLTHNSKKPAPLQKKSKMAAG